MQVKEKEEEGSMDIIYIFYAISIFIASIVVLLIVRYKGDYPFPWEMRKRNPNPMKQPDSLALSQCFDDLSDSEEMHITMGNVSSLVCEKDIVIDSLKKALEKDITLKLIHGPEVDTRSKRFLNLLRKSKKVEFYEYPTDPDLHFRILIDAEGHAREVCVEEPHRPYEDHGFRRVPSRKASREYEKMFEGMLTRSRALK